MMPPVDDGLQFQDRRIEWQFQLLRLALRTLSNVRVMAATLNLHSTRGLFSATWDYGKRSTGPRFLRLNVALRSMP